MYLSGKLALVSTFCLLFLAVPLAYLLSYVSFRGKSFIEALINLPLVLPPTVLGFYLLTFFGHEGFVGRLWYSLTGEEILFTFAGIVVGSIVHSLPYAVQPLKTGFEKVDVRLLESSVILGCSKISAFFKVILPNSINGVLAAVVLTFAHIMGEFGVVLMIGGSIPGKTKVASIAIYEYVEVLRYREAWHLSLALLGMSYLVLTIVILLNNREKISVFSSCR